MEENYNGNLNSMSNSHQPVDNREYSQDHYSHNDSQIEFERNVNEVEVSQEDAGGKENHTAQETPERNLQPIDVLSETQPIGNHLVTEAKSTISLKNENETLSQSLLHAFKCTRQVLQEKMGRVSRTMDPMLESRIDAVREAQLRYRQMLDSVQQLIDGFRQAFLAQAALSGMFYSMGRKTPHLGPIFAYTSQTQKALCQNGEHLLGAMEFFRKGLLTLCDKTTADCLETVRKMEHFRVEYDVYRRELECMNTPSEDAKKKMDKAYKQYEALKHDVDVKIRLLDDNRNRVLQKHLLLFNNAITTFYSGNQSAVDALIKEFKMYEFQSVQYPDTYLLSNHLPVDKTLNENQDDSQLTKSDSSSTNV